MHLAVGAELDQAVAGFRERGAAGPLSGDIVAVEQDCSMIRPTAGHLIVFDGRQHPHYARPLRSDSDLRVVAVMNFYTESSPESTRPRELNRHLYGDR